MKSYPMLVVRDVPASSAWYQELLDTTSGHGGNEFDMITSGHDLLLLLHHGDHVEHGGLTSPNETPGSGVLIYFSVDDLGPVFERAQAMGAKLIDEPHMNEKASSVEFSLYDPDGYALTVSQWKG